MRNREHDKAIIAADYPTVRYYTDGRPYIVLGGMEVANHPVIDKLAEMDRLEKHVLPGLLAWREKAEKLLQYIEWNAGGDEYCQYKYCPYCRWWEQSGHSLDCELAALLGEGTK